MPRSEDALGETLSSSEDKCFEVKVNKGKCIEAREMEQSLQTDEDEDFKVIRY